MRNLILGITLAAITVTASAPVMAKAKRAEPGELPAAFSRAWEHHDAQELSKIFLPNVNFINVGAIWLHGPDFELFHSRLFKDRFRTSTITPLATDVRYIRPDIAIVRWSWRMGMTLGNGSSGPPRFGLMTMIAEKKGKHWLISNAQNTNSGPAVPEAEGLKTPLDVPRAL